MTFLVPYAYDRMPGGKPREGVPANRLGSKARCDALNRFKYSFGYRRFILVAGFTKESPCEPTQQIMESMAVQMEKYLLSQEAHPSKICSYEDAWGTYEETKAVIQRIKNITINDWLSNKPEIYISTNLGHIPRVMLCWLFLKPKKWEVYFVRANHSFTPKEWAQETIKFFSYLYRFVFKKW